MKFNKKRKEWKESVARVVVITEEKANVRGGVERKKGQ